jgi:hypothetical protein
MQQAHGNAWRVSQENRDATFKRMIVEGLILRRPF